MKYYTPNLYIIIAFLSVFIGLIVYTTISYENKLPEIIIQPSIEEPSLNFYLINPDSLIVMTQDKDKKIFNQYRGSNSNIYVPPGGYFMVISPDAGGTFYWTYKDLAIYNKKTATLTVNSGDVKLSLD